MTTLKLYLDTRRKSSNGYPIMLCVRHSGDVAYLSTKVYVPSADWYCGEPEQAININYDGAAKANLVIYSKYCDINRVIMRHQLDDDIDTISASDIITEATGGKSLRTTMFVEYLNSVGATKKSGTRKTYEMTSKLWVRLMGDGYKVPQVVEDAVRKFDTLMQSEKCNHGKGLSANSRAIHHHNISCALNTAVRDGIFRRDRLPYGEFGFKIPKKRKTEIDALSVGEVRAFYNSPIDPRYTRMAAARDIWFLSLYLGGLNPTDLFHLKKSDVVNGIIRIRRRKTDVPIVMTIQPEAQSIINQYIGTGRYLLRFADDWGEEFYEDWRTSITHGITKWKNLLRERNEAHWLSFDFARYTFSSICDELEIDDIVVNKCLGHADSGVQRLHYSPYHLFRTDKAIRQVIDFLDLNHSVSS